MGLDRARPDDGHLCQKERLLQDEARRNKLKVAREQSGTTEGGVENIVDPVRCWGKFRGGEQQVGGRYVITLLAGGLSAAIEETGMELYSTPGFHRV